MTTLKIKTLTCNATEDRFGGDDPYIIVNRKKVWGPIKAEAGDELIINEQVDFKLTAVVELWEQDLDPDDHMGTHVISQDNAGKGLQHFTFKYKTASYELAYEITE
ncbi:MAG: hypothetical protein DRQ47_00095 [Gammaproteobacteria bacterium]|nr:MAG: hypothetical protein DRQ47_00095 [Gammaproteobacteria bacterium]